MADEKEFDTYVKLGRRGLIERTPTTMRELVNLRGTGWVRKGSRFEPSAEAVAAVEKRAEEADSTVGLSPTSAAHAAADPEAYNAVPQEAEETKKSAPRKSATAGAKADTDAAAS